MTIHSPYPDILIPELDILTYLFGDGSPERLSDEPLWINAADTSKSISPRAGLEWIKRLAVGLDKLGVQKGEVVMIVTPNHIFVPIAYLGTVGSGRIFSGANPLYTADGRWVSLFHGCEYVCMHVSTDGPFEECDCPFLQHSESLSLMLHRVEPNRVLFLVVSLK